MKRGFAKAEVIRTGKKLNQVFQTGIPKIKYVQIATHSRCNADCLFCPYIESQHHANKGIMTDETWKRILDNLTMFRDTLQKICPYLMQEPLIDKTIFDKIAMIYQYFPEVCVEISTNGAALTQVAVDRLFSVFAGRKHDIWVSHHGIDKETLEHIMKIDYQKSTENLINLIRESDGRFQIRIRGAGRSRAVDKTFFTRDQYLQYWREMADLHDLNMTNVSIDSFDFHDRAGTLTREDRGANQLNGGIVRKIDKANPFYCPRIDQWLHFMWDGSIRMCCMDYHHEVKLPNINEMSLIDYFESRAYETLVGQVGGSVSSPDNFICKRCTSPGG